jgi:hypothetical protein
MTRTVIPVTLAVLSLAACAAAQQAPPAAATPPSTQAMSQQDNVLTAAERAAGWQLLFDGQTTAGWRPYQGEGAISAVWRVVDGVLTKSRPGDDIVTTRTYGDFELTFDWKVSRGGNAGLFFRATEEYSKIYWSAPEFQLLDDANARDGQNPLTSAGAAYGLWPAPRGVARGADEWNTSRIVARGAHIEHWMNGQKTIEYEAWSPEWESRVQGSKFKDYPNFGRAKAGLIGIQGDHGGVLSLRNIKIREIR